MAVDKPRGGVIIFRDITREKEERAKLEETVSELQVQAQLLETIFESMDEGLAVADAEGCLVLANSRMEEILGLGMVTSRPDDWSATYGAYRSDRKTLIPTEELPLVRALRGLSTDEMEVYVRNQKRPEGVYVSATGRPILGEDGKVRAGVVAFRDVTSHRDAQTRLSNTVARLRSQTRLMRTVFDSMSDGLIVADADGEFTIFNPSAEKIVGIGMLEVPPDQWTETYGVFWTDQETHVPMEDLPLVRAMGGEAIDEMELFIRNDRRPEGVFISVSGRPLKETSDGQGGGVIVFRDITAQKRAQADLARSVEELRKQSELMETTFDSISDGIVVADAAGNFLYINPAAERIVGMGATDSDPQEWSEEYGTFYPDRRTPVESEDLPLLRAIFRGESSEDEDLFVRNEKRPEGVFIRVSGRPLLNDLGGVRGGVIVFRDVTDQMLSEEALARAFAQGRLEMIDTILHNIGNAINSVTVGARTVHQDLASNLALRRFLALADAVRLHREDWVEYVSNNPQGQKVMPLILSLAKDFSEVNEELVTTMGRVRERADHIADIIRTQKALGNSSMHQKDLNLEEGFRDAIRVMQDSFDKRGASVDIDCGDAPKMIRIQESQFHQMMVNLLKNSLEAVDGLAASGRKKETPCIRIRAGVEGDHLRIEVSDNGIGVALKEVGSRIFRAGYSTKEGGSGLGLHSVAGFVGSLGGRIQPFSAGLGKGTTMRILLRLSSVVPPGKLGLQDRGES